MSSPSGKGSIEQSISAVAPSATAFERIDIELLLDLSVELIRERDVEQLYQKIMDAAVAIMRSQYASMQLLSPTAGAPGSDGELRLLAFRGFNPEAAKLWKWVSANSQSTCGMALRNGKRSIAPDVETCEFMAGSEDLANYRLTGIRSVQTTPLISRDGKVIGMISTHWSAPHQPSERDFRLMDILARQAADLLERTKAEDALRTSERQLAGILGSVTDAFMSFDAEFQFTFANEQCAGRMGKSPSELIGLNLWEFLPDAVGNIAHRELTWAMTERVAVEYEVFYEPWQRWFSDKAYPTADGGLAVYSQDITARKQAEASLRESEDRFRAMADNIPQLAWMAEPGTEGQATWFNKVWLDYTGTTMEQNKGSGWQAVHHPDHAPRVIANFEHHVREGLDWEDTFPLRGKNGSFRWFLSRMNVIRDAFGKPARIFGTNTDITELRQAEEMQRLLTGELSHRVKNMLATVQAIAAQTLRHNRNPAEFVTSFCSRIQSMSRVHSQLSGGDWRGADLRDVIRDQVLLGPVDETRVTAWGPRVSLEPQIVPQVAMMLNELGTNSIKYGALSKPNGVVTISWTVGDDMLCLRWAERGAPSVRAPAKRGFGTALIEQSAKSAGGGARMSIEADGVQWEITLRLPRAASGNALPVSTTEFVEAAAPREEAGSPHAAAPMLAGKRFLVIEDEPLIALDVVGLLEDAGAEIAGSVGDASEALDLIESTRLDGALLDANLSGRSVDDIAAALTRQHVPFAFVTGYGRHSLPRAFATAAMLSKPFSGQQLLEAAAKLVRKPADVRKLRR